MAPIVTTSSFITLGRAVGARSLLADTLDARAAARLTDVASQGPRV